MKNYFAAFLLALLMSSSIFAQTTVTGLAGTVIVSDSLKAVGSTTVLKVNGFSKTGRAHHVNSLTVQYKAINVDTNAVIALEASHDNSDWYNLDEEGNTTIIADDTYAFEVGNISSKQYFRFRLVSETDGTNVIFIVKWIFGG